MSPHTMPRLALVAALLTAASVGQAQNAGEGPRAGGDGRVTGVVIDERDGAPVEGALVFLSDGRSMDTDEEGRFSFPHVRPGEHQIGAITHGCARVEGGFSMTAGKEARIRLEVAVPGGGGAASDRGRGTAVTVLGEDELAGYQDRPVWFAIRQVVPYHGERSASGTTLRNTRSATLGSGEPLLIMDGVRLRGDVQSVLSGVSSAEVTRVEIHRGAVGGWEYGYGAENGVIVVTTRGGWSSPPSQAPETCVRMD